MAAEIIVLHVVGRMDIGGAESRIMDLYRRMDRQKVQFHFMQHTAERCAYQEEIEGLGGKVYFVPRFRGTNLAAYVSAWKRFFREHPEVRIVHGHMTSTAGIYLPIARKTGHCYTIAHARSAGVDPGLKGTVTRLLRKNLWKKCDTCFTCSHLAGEAVFGTSAVAQGKVHFFPNAIEVEKFAFDENIRAQVRRELGLENAFVLGHVGRFSPVKNHAFLLHVLAACLRLEREEATGWTQEAGDTKEKTVLLLLGDGPLRENMMQRAVEMGISSRVFFLGNRTDIYRYYAAMDVFLLPSLYEGLPGTAIEAQASGLPGVLADTVTQEAVITDLMVQRGISRNESQETPDGRDAEQEAKWAEEIQRIRESQRENALQKRTGYAKEVKERGYDVADQARWLQEFYATKGL